MRNVTNGSLTLLKNYEGKLHFTTDAWTSPNHRAYMAVAVHFERDGIPFSICLDIVEVAKVGLSVFAAIRSKRTLTVAFWL